MIQVSVLYAGEQGARFDFDYYKNKHMPMVKDKLGSACSYYTVERGVAGALPDLPPLYVALCHIYSDSADEFFQAFGANAKEIMSDVPNYTDLEPALQVSEVLVDRG